MKHEAIPAVRALLEAMDVPPVSSKQVMDILEGKSKPAQDVWLRTKEAAQLLGVHPQTLFRYRRRGVLDSVKRSRRCIRWSQQGIQRLMMEGIDRV